MPIVLGGDARKFSSVYIGGNGQERPCYRFPKREACLMAMSYSYELQAKVFDRMTQLEQVAADPRIPKTYVEALRLAADQADTIAKKDAQLAIAAPKAEALDKIATADGSLCITDAAKALQMRPKDLFSWLQANEWIYRRAGGAGWIGYQSRVQVGLLEHKVNTVERSDGSEKVVERVLITAKGLAKLAQVTKPVAQKDEVSNCANSRDLVPVNPSERNH